MRIIDGKSVAQDIKNNLKTAIALGGREIAANP